MALTRKSLKAMGLADEQVDSIIEMHTETVDGLKDTAALDALIGGDYKSLIVTQSKQGVPAANPPKNGDGKIMTREEIYKKDDKGRYVLDAAARQKALVDMAEAESNN